jgi:uncharacterized integral membrane protein
VRKILTAAVLVPVAALLLIFALANRAPVVLSLDPFSPGAPAWSVQLPLFLIILVAIAFGVVIGGVTDWIGQGRHRREARHGKAEIRRLEQEAQALRRAQMPPQESLPAPYAGDNR